MARGEKIFLSVNISPCLMFCLVRPKQRLGVVGRNTDSPIGMVSFIKRKRRSHLYSSNLGFVPVQVEGSRLVIVMPFEGKAPD